MNTEANQTLINLNRLAVPVIDYAGQRIVRRLARLVVIEPYPQEYKDQLGDLLANFGVPIEYSNHISHIDPVAHAMAGANLVEVAKEKGQEDNLTGLIMGIASSVASGHQSILMKISYESFRQVMVDLGLIMVPVTRQKDRDLFKIIKSTTELKPFLRALKEGKGIATLPEASVQGGRQSQLNPGEICGIQDIANDVLLKYAEIITRVRRNVHTLEPFYQPLGIEGTQDFFSPDNLSPTPEGLVSLFERLSKLLSPLGFDRRIIKGRFGAPITRDVIRNNLGSDWENDPIATNRFLMKKVASLVEPQYQGVHKTSSSFIIAR